MKSIYIKVAICFSVLVITFNSVLGISNLNVVQSTNPKQKKLVVTKVVNTKKTTKKVKYKNNKKQKQTQKTIRYKSYSVHPSASNFKTYMDYRCITMTSSPQYKLQQKAYTTKNGLRKVGKYYCIALGSYYGSTIGAKYRITLSTGKKFWAVLADQKSDAHTNSTNQYTIGNNDMVEFVVYTPKLPSSVTWSGSISSIKKFNGKIKKVERVI